MYCFMSLFSIFMYLMYFFNIGFLLSFFICFYSIFNWMFFSVCSVFIWMYWCHRCIIFQRLLSEMKQQLIEALGATFIGDNAKLRQANISISELSMQAGYSISLMEIVDDQSMSFPMKQAALIQLKNMVKSRWKPKFETTQISLQERTSIRNSLITAIIRCSKNHMLIKLYREILCNVISYQYENWIPMVEILDNIKSCSDIPAIFHCILAICSNFQFSIVEKERNYYSEFLYAILPEVLNAIKNNIGNAEIIYLGLKILYKAVHYEVPKEIKMLTNPWMELLLLTITAENEAMNKKTDEIQQKGTQEFFYFHSKKWATRILMRFVQKHAKEVVFGSNSDNKEFSEMWYKNYAEAFVNAIIHQLSVPTIKKVRFFQLKIIQGWVLDKPAQMLNFATNFQYQLLPPFMALTVEDERLATDDVIEYMRNEDQPINFTNLKRGATDVWISFFQIGSRTDRDLNVYHPGPMFQPNFQFLLEKLQSQNLVEKELAMYLFCQIRMNLNKVPAAKEMMPKILANYILPQFNNPAMLLRARANDMFAEYGKFIQDTEIVKLAAEAIFKSMSEDPSPLVRIRAAIAFHPILSDKNTKDLVRPMLKNILEIYLKLIQSYDLEPIISALEYIIADFSGDIGPFAIDMFKYLSGLFVKMFNKDTELSQNEDYSSEIQIAASGTLKTMSQIIEAPLTPDVRQKIQALVLEVCAFIFSNDSVDYTQDIMYLLNAHLFRLQRLSPDIWFFYQVVIYFLVGIPKQLWAQIDNLAMPGPHKLILQNIRQSRNTDYVEHAVPVLRNFITKGSSMILTQKEEFKSNFMQMFFYLVSNIYKQHSQEAESETELDCATILFVYLVETFPPEFTKNVTPAIWNFVKFNFVKGKSSYLKLINLQLIFVLFWKNPIEFHQLVTVTEKYLPALGNFFKENIPRLEESHERKRIILGICSMLMLQNKSHELESLLPFLFKTVLNLIKKNCKSRKLLSLEAQQRKQQIMRLEEQADDSDEEKSKEEEYDDDEDDFWDEDYHERFDSALSKIDQIKYFQDTMTWLQTNDSNLYQILISMVGGEKLGNLNNKMQEAMSLRQM